MVICEVIMTASFRSIITKHSLSLILWPLLCVGLYLTSLYSYILFHIVAESFSIVIAFSLFMIAWNTRHLTKNNYVLFLSIAFLFAGLIDFVHTLAYKGMGIFVEFDANLPTQLWIIARYLQSMSLLVAPWFIDRKLNPAAVFGFYLSATLLLLAAVFSGTLFPDCFIEGTGLTPFKVVSEYIICFILICSFVFLLPRREKFDPKILRLIAWSILCTIVSELSFTFYISVYGLSNLIGHFLKIFSFYFIYKAIIVTGLENPYSLLFHDLQKQREELQIIIDSSPIMIFYKDSENKFIRVNKALAVATGLPKEAIEGKTGFEIYPNRPTSYWEDDKDVIASGKPKINIIEPLAAATGTKWIQTDKIPYRDKEGQIIGIIGFAVDITERKQAEEALLQEQQFSKSVLDSLPGIFYLYTYPEHRLVLWNKQHETLLGYTAEEMKDRFAMDWHLPEVKDAVLKATEEVMEKGHSSVESSLLAKDGHLVPFFLTGVRFEAQGRLYYMGIGTDITERKRAEEAVGAKRRQLTDIIEFLPDATLAIDKEGRVIIWNKAIEEMTGIPAEEIIGKGNYVYTIPFYGEARPQLMDLVFADHEEIAVRYPKITREGDTLMAEVFCSALYDNKGAWVIAKASPLHDQSGNIVGAIESIRDITESKQAEETLKTALREKETLLREIHHRVKNNLQIISSLLKLQARYIGDEKMEEIFRECQDRITAMASVHSLLYRSQNFAEINFGEYVRETAGELFRTYKTGTAAISLIVHADNVMLPIDTAVPCGLIINELITNSLKYAFPELKKGEITIEMNRTEEGVRLLFEDNGIGFPKDIHFNNTETFGLKLVHMLVKQLDGSIEQDTNNGTRYVIMFKTETLQEM